MNEFQTFVCNEFVLNDWGRKVIIVNVVEVTAGLYYFGLATTGFRNIYVIFYKQKKLASVIFPLMYFFG